MDTTQANERAQAAFRAALEARDRAGRWTQPEVDAYLNAERDVDWERAKAAMDAELAADHDFHEFSGVVMDSCTDCQEHVGMMWVRMGRAV